MGTIKYNEGYDHIITSQNGKRFKILDEQFINFNKYTEKYSIRLDDIENAKTINFLNSIIKDKLEIFYTDLDFTPSGEEKLVFGYGTYINDKFYEITPELIKDLFFKQNPVEINIDLVDSKNNGYNYLNFSLSFEKGESGLFSSSPAQIHITEKYIFNKFKFVNWLADNNFASIIDNKKEVFEEI